MMILQHNVTWAWFVDGPLSACRARLLRSRRPGRLTVSAGRVWVTRSGDLDDHVLGAGQALAIRAHEQVVVEPWGEGGASLAWRTDQPRSLAARAFDALAAARRGLSTVGAAWAALARSAAASAKRAQGSIARGESSASSGAVQ